MSKNSTKQVIVASLSNLLVAAAIVAAGCGTDSWIYYFNNVSGGSVTAEDFGLLSGLSANCFSAAVGALVGGLLADRYGRRNIFSFAMLLFLLGVGITTTSTSFAQLATGVFVTGLAAGATVPASWSYIAEASEKEHRGRNMAISQFAWGLGAAGVLWLSTANAPGSYMYEFVKWVANDLYGITWNESNPAQTTVFGVRLIFATIYAVGMVTWVLQRQLEETDVWKAEIESHEGKGTSITRAFTHIFSGKYIKPLLCLTIMYLTWNLVASLMGSFQTHIYETVASLPKEWANRLNVWQWVLTCALTFWGIFIIDKWDNKKLFLTFVSIAILTWVIVTVLGISNIVTLIIVTILWAVQAGISVQLFFALWGTEIFPTRYRATAVGIMFCLVRVASTFGCTGFALIWGDPDKVSDTMFTVSAACMIVILAISAAIGFYYAHDSRGKSLDEISHELYDNK